MISKIYEACSAIIKNNNESRRLYKRVLVTHIWS